MTKVKPTKKNNPINKPKPAIKKNNLTIKPPEPTFEFLWNNAKTTARLNPPLDNIAITVLFNRTEVKIYVNRHGIVKKQVKDL